MEYNPKDFEQLLAEFKEPTNKGKVIPYVAFGRYLKDRKGTEIKIIPHIFVLNMSGAHAQKEQLAYYVMQKQFRVLKWNLPNTNSTETGRASYHELIALCQMYQQAGNVPELMQKLQAAEEKALGLEAAIAEQQAKLEKRAKV